MEEMCKQRKKMQRSYIKSAFTFQKYHVTVNVNEMKSLF